MAKAKQISIPTAMMQQECFVFAILRPLQKPVAQVRES